MIPKLSLSLLILFFQNNSAWASTKEVGITNIKVEGNEITTRIKVTGNNQHPIVNLKDTDFQVVVDDQEVLFSSKNWQNPSQTIPPPAWIIILLDMSGSMNQVDSKGLTKLQGAITAIREFINITNQKKNQTQIAIVPFGESNQSCSQGFRVNKQTLNQFFSPQNPQLEAYLNQLSQLKPCAATNLYQPLEAAIRFLGNIKDPRFYSSEEASEFQPRLSIILLSDGYHNQGDEQKEFAQLKSLIRRNKNIIIHTLGYGLTPKQLGKKYNLGTPATRQDIISGKVKAEEFVEQKRLAQIAHLTGGIAEFSGDATTIADNLKLFLDALLGEYQITYTQPEAQRGSKHKVMVEVNFPDGEIIASPSKTYTITVFGRSLPLKMRLMMISGIFLVLIFGGLLPFYFWSQKLEQES